MSARALAWAWRQEPATTSQKLVLAALADRADDDGECFPSASWIAEKCAPMTERTVRRCLADLTDQGFVAKVERRRRGDGTLGTWIYRLPVDDEQPVTTHDQPAATSGHLSPAATSGRTDLDLPDGEVEPDGSKAELDNKAILAKRIDSVQGVWRVHSPPLIAHRDSYMAEHGVRAAVHRALRRYPVEVIAEAVANYAAVLGGDEFFWNHRWTLTDFLKRGLDRFVPEARPLENFRVNGGPATKFGRRDVSPRELLDAAERLEGERATD